MNLTEENRQVLHLLQAMLGSITPNFRRVTLELDRSGAVSLRFVLAEDRQEDRDEVEEIAFDFEAFQDHDMKVHTEIIVTTSPLESLVLPGRHVFGRKEHPV